ncbi:hypothetical protein [Pseudoalteromonas sp. TB51]|nr:hypothetical protein [Pseudoalteromonas sp. TB51]
MKTAPIKDQKPPKFRPQSTKTVFLMTMEQLKAIAQKEYRS